MPTLPCPTTAVETAPITSPTDLLQAILAALDASGIEATEVDLTDRHATTIRLTLGGESCRVRIDDGRDDYPLPERTPEGWARHATQVNRWAAEYYERHRQPGGRR